MDDRMRHMLALLLLFGVCQAQVEVYRWIDEEGVVHFGDRFDPRREAQRLRVPPANGADPFRPVPPGPPLRAPARRTPAAPAEDPDEARAEFLRAEACLAARSKLRELRETRRRGYRISEASRLELSEREARARARAFCD